MQIGIFISTLSTVTFLPSFPSWPQMFMPGFHVCVSFRHTRAHSVFPEFQSMHVAHCPPRKNSSHPTASIILGILLFAILSLPCKYKPSLSRSRHPHINNNAFGLSHLSCKIEKLHSAEIWVPGLRNVRYLTLMGL